MSTQMSENEGAASTSAVSALGSLDAIIRVGSRLALALVAVGGAWAVITRLSNSRTLARQDGHDELRMRRPLEFLGQRLGLDERQSAELARILDDLKTTRAQAATEARSTEAAFAQALMADTLEPAKLSETTNLRIRHAERLHQASATAFTQLHALLNPAQRQQLAALILGGSL